MRINTNIGAINANRNLELTQDALNSSLAKLSSGFRINRAGDDAAGLGIANLLRATTGALTTASNNADQANSLLQIAEGAAGSVESMLERMGELATEAGSDTVDANGRAEIQNEYSQLSAEIQRTVKTTKFEGNVLLDGTYSNAEDLTGGPGAYTNSTILNFANGATATGITISGTPASSYTFDDSVAGKLKVTDTAGNTQTLVLSQSGKQIVNFGQFGIQVSLGSTYAAGTANSAFGTGAAATKVLKVTQGTGGNFLVGASGNVAGQDYISIGNFDLQNTTLGVNGLDMTSTTGAQTALTAISAAIQTVNTTLGTIGASQNRIQDAAENVKTSIQNYSAAESTIRDLDMASEMTNFSKENILAQAGTAMLAQANQTGQSVLKLLNA